MKVKDLIKQLKKIKDDETYVGFGVWFGDRNWKTGHTIFWDGNWNRKVEVVRPNNCKGLKVAIVGMADNCLSHTFSLNESKEVKK